MLSMGPNLTCCSRGDSGAGRKLSAADSSHPKAGLGHRHPALILSSWASRRICAQKPRPTVIPLEPEVRLWLQAQAHWSQTSLEAVSTPGEQQPGRKPQISMARHQREVSPVSIRACHLQSFLMLRAAAVSPHNHLDKVSEEAGLGNMDIRGKKREMNIGDADS